MIRRLIILLLIVGCEEPSQHGCLDSQATNYDADATIDNNSCIYKNGCVDKQATNYDSTAFIDDNSCTYCEYGDYWDVGKQDCTECESVDDCPGLCEEGFWWDFMIHECVECGIDSSSGNSNNIGC